MSTYSQIFSRDSPVALYRQLKAWIVGELERGTWVPGGQLPSERTLVAKYGVSRITVRQALRDLTQEGLLVSVPGKGFFVAERPTFPLDGLVGLSDLAKDRGLAVSSRVLEAEAVAATPALARQLEIPAGAELVRIVRVRLLNGVQVCVQTLWIPEHRCHGLLDEDLEKISLFELYRGRFGIVLARAESAISARLATPEEQALLDLDAGAAVLTVDQRTLDIAGEPVELSLSVHHPGRFPVSLVHEAGSPSAVRRSARSGQQATELR